MTRQKMEEIARSNIERYLADVAAEYDSEEAAAAIVPLVGSETRVVTLQNGIDSVETLARFVPRSQVVGGNAYISAHLERPGLIVHAGGVARPRLTPAGAAIRKLRHSERPAFGRVGWRSRRSMTSIRRSGSSS